MAQLRGWVRLAQRWLEFGLPLLCMTVVLWYGSQWLNHQVLSQTHATATQLDATPQQIQLRLTFSVLAIDAEVDRRLGNTEVTIQTAGSPLKELEFEYPITQFAELEQAIAQDLNLSAKMVRALIRYRLD
ncbi:MAG TPA: hypothetical protein V6C63_20515 [Allocoleopsis sp.]